MSNIVVQPLEASIIQSIDVRIGQVVKKGDRLAMLDPTFVKADESELRSRLSSLETQSLRLEDELTGNKRQISAEASVDGQLQAQLAAERQANYRAQLRKMEETERRLRAAIETNRLDQGLLSERVKNLRKLEAMQEQLVDQKVAAPARLFEERERRLGVERDLHLVKNQEVELKLELSAFEAEKTAFEKSWRQKTMEDLLATSRDLNALGEQLQKADKRNRMVELVAPADAVVLDIAKLSQGSVVRGAEALITLVPLAAELEAEVQIDSLDVGYVKLGDVARVKFDAYPFQKHGALEAKLRTISEDAFRRDAATGQGLDAYYSSRVSLDSLRLRNMSEHSRLLPGMTLTAEIVVGKRSVMSYLLWPLTKALNDSIREP
jgi:HlyD family secretion protein